MFYVVALRIGLPKNNARNRYSWWSKRRTLGNLVEYEGRFARWVEGKSRESGKDTDVEVDVAVEVIEGREKSQGCDGAGDVVAQVLQRVRICGRDRCWYNTIKVVGITATPYQLEGKKKRNIQEHAEVDTRAYDFNQKIIMHVLDTLAEEYEVFMLTTTCAFLHWMYSCEMDGRKSRSHGRIVGMVSRRRCRNWLRISHVSMFSKER